MTGDEIIERFRSMVDDNLDEAFLLALANDAKDEMEAERPWEQLKAELAIAVPSGASYLTPVADLPAGFIEPVSLCDAGGLPYSKAAFEDRSAKERDGRAYFLDVRLGHLHLCGSGHAAKTLYLCYAASTAEITGSTEWAFPERFHQLIPLKMAKLYYAVDGGEKGRAWDDRWDAEYSARLSQMERWDARLKLSSRRRPVTEGRRSIA